MSERLSALLDAHLSLPASWPASLVAALLVLAAGAIAYSWAFRLLERLSARTDTQLDDLLLRRMRPPAKVLVALAGVHVLLSLRGVDLPALRSGVAVVELLLLAYIVIETAETFFFRWYLHERRQLPVPAVVRHLVLIVLYTAVVLTVLGSVTGLDLVPVLATSTVVTVVVGLALQDTLGNLFSGLALHIERPFELGDWVLVDTTEGQVTYMGWRSTHLRTFSGDIAVFPNSVVARARVQNFCAPERRTSRIVEVPVRLSAPPEAVEAAFRAACADVPAVLGDPAPRVWLVGVTPLFQRYNLKFWLEDFGVHDDTESDVQKAVWRRLHGAGLGLGEPAHPAGVGPSGEVVASFALNSRRT